jgi:hypothetical protein
MRNWISIVQAPTVEAYEERVKGFKDRWTASYLEDVAYIESNWLNPRNKNYIVSAWTDEWLHLGNTIR